VADGKLAAQEGDCPGSYRRAMGVALGLRERAGELFVDLTRKVPKPLSVREAAALIENLGAWTVHSPGVRDVVYAIELHERMDVTIWDAMILTNANSMGCRVLYSEDLSAGQSYDGVLVVNPFDAGS
jgi:predicted nucleic acid-binding protein